MHVRENVTQPTDPSYRLIALTQGQVCKVDASDYEWLIRRHWHAIWEPTSKRFYARSKGQYMHRIILAVPPGILVDHKDLDGLNNRRYNLRRATRQQNNANKGLQKNNTTGFKGIQPQGCGWVARAKVGGKLHHLGTFPTAQEAGHRVTEFTAQCFGEFHREK